MPQQLLNLVTPSTILATLPALASAKIDMVNPSLMAPDSSSGARSIAAGIENTNNNRGPLGKTFDALQAIMLKKMDPEAQARQKVLEAEAKKAELAASPEVLEMEKQKRQLEMQDINDRLEGRKFDRAFMEKEFGAKQNQLTVDNSQKQAELELRRKNLETQAQGAQTEEELKRIQIEKEKLDLDQRKLDSQAAQGIPTLPTPGISSAIPNIGEAAPKETRESLIAKHAQWARIATNTKSPQAAAQVALIEDKIKQLDAQREFDAKLEYKKRENEMSETKPTETEAAAAAYASRMKQNEATIAKSRQGDNAYLNESLARLPNWAIPHAAMSPNRQSYEAAKGNWIAATLRKESGAAIEQSEYDAADKQYFPQPGDSAEVVAQKAALRDTAQKDMAAMAGKHYKKTEGSKNATSEKKAEQPAEAQVPTVTSKAEYDVLPSGTRYIGPDGRMATKK